jgi:hypothetical protein
MDLLGPQRWIVLMIELLPAGLLLLIILLVGVIDFVQRITIPREFRFLYLPVRIFPSEIDDKAIARLQRLRAQVEKQLDDTNREVCLRYLEAIDRVLSTRSREAVLYLLALRICLQREVRSRRSN